MTPEAYTVQEAAAKLGVSRRAVSTWLGDGTLTGHKKGRQVLIPAPQVEKLAQDRETPHKAACEVCGEVFVVDQAGQRYCGPSCRRRAAYDRDTKRRESPAGRREQKAAQLEAVEKVRELIDRFRIGN